MPSLALVSYTFEWKDSHQETPQTKELKGVIEDDLDEKSFLKACRNRLYFKNYALGSKTGFRVTNVAREPVPENWPTNDFWDCRYNGFMIFRKAVRRYELAQYARCVMTD